MSRFSSEYLFGGEETDVRKCRAGYLTDYFAYVEAKHCLDEIRDEITWDACSKMGVPHNQARAYCSGAAAYREQLRKTRIFWQQTLASWSTLVRLEKNENYPSLTPYPERDPIQ